MMIIENKLACGVYLLLCENESAILDIFGNSEILKLNLVSPEAYKVPAYFKEHKLKRLQSSIASNSDHPNQLLAAAVSILQEADTLIIGTIGLSKESLVSIMNELNKFRNKQIFIVHTCYEKDVKILHVTPINIDEVIGLL